MNQTLKKYFPNGLLIGERKEKTNRIFEPKPLFMTDEELFHWRLRFIVAGICVAIGLVFIVRRWLI